MLVTGSGEEEMRDRWWLARGGGSGGESFFNGFPHPLFPAGSVFLVDSRLNPGEPFTLATSRTCVTQQSHSSEPCAESGNPETPEGNVSRVGAR